MSYKRKRPLQVPTDREMTLVMENIRHPRDKLIAVLAEKHGLRAAEIAILRISDLHFGEKPVLDFVGKGSKPAILPLTDETLGYVERALAVRPDNCEHDFLIWNLKKKQTGISAGEIWHIVHKAGAEAGLHLWPHLLRHKCATDLWRKTGSGIAVQSGLRHTRFSTTALYCHPTVEDMRPVFELLDKRSWVLKMLSKIKPPVPNRFIKKPAPVFTGDTIGRSEILGKLNANLNAGIHSVLWGQRGAGKSHVLRQISGPDIYRLDSVKPPREKLEELCKKMHNGDTLQEMPTGKSTDGLLKSLVAALDGKHCTVIIDTMDNITSDGIALLRELKEHVTIFTSIDEKKRSKVGEIFFGGRDVIDVLPLESDDAFALADKASMDLPTTPEGREGFLKRVASESKGNPKAIMEIIDKERRRGHVVDADTEVEHEAIQEPLPARPIIKYVGLVCFAGRFVASRLGMPDLALILIGMAVIAGFLVLVDFILEKASRL